MIPEDAAGVVNVDLSGGGRVTMGFMVGFLGTTVGWLTILKDNSSVGRRRTCPVGWNRVPFSARAWSLILPMSVLGPARVEKLSAAIGIHIG